MSLKENITLVVCQNCWHISYLQLVLKSWLIDKINKDKNRLFSLRKWKSEWSGFQFSRLGNVMIENNTHNKFIFTSLWLMFSKSHNLFSKASSSSAICCQNLSYIYLKEQCLSVRLSVCWYRFSGKDAFCAKWIK